MNSSKKIETDVPSILKRDGVEENDLFDVNHEMVNLEKILAGKPKDKSWSKRVIDSENNSMTVIAQLPGEGNRRHYHPDWNEWWFIVQGSWLWEVDGNTRSVNKGDIVFVRKNRVHMITATGTEMAIRMAVSRADVEHVYV